MKVALVVVNGIRYGTCNYGDESGFPVFYFHGFSGSRIDGYIYGFDEAAKKAGLRIIGVDRPGIGYSDFQPYRTLLSWHKDIEVLADALHLSEFSILGISGGGPYALACAYALDQRLKHVVTISSMAPFYFSESITGMAMMVPKQPYLIRYLMGLGFMIGTRHMRTILKKLLRGYLAEADDTFLSHPEREEHLMNCVLENFRQGTRGYLHDASLYRKDWQFNPAHIKRHVILWHGTADKNVSIEASQRLAALLPNHQLIIRKGEGHFSITGHNIDEIFSQL